MRDKFLIVDFHNPGTSGIYADDMTEEWIHGVVFLNPKIGNLIALEAHGLVLTFHAHLSINLHFDMLNKC